MAANWKRRFDEPIVLPDGKLLITLRDAIAWLAKEIPKSEQGLKQVQAAAHCVTEAAENDGPMMFAQMGTGDQPTQAGGIRPETEEPTLGKTQAQEGRMKS